VSIPPRVFRVLCAILVGNLSLIPLSAQQTVRQPLITQPINESVVVTLKGNTYPMARPQFDIGAAPPDLPMNRMLLVLKRSPQQEYALSTLIDSQQDKNSPNYHKWMTPAQFGAQFGATDQDVQMVTGWLQTHGFQIDRVSNGRSVIEFSGVESQVEQTFHTQIHRYLMPDGTQHWANASDPQIPAALAPAVEGLWSLHDFRKQPRLRISKNRIPIPAKGASPLLTFNGQHALMPGDFATIYNLNPLYGAGVNGQGATIAVVARSNINYGDISSFRSLAGLPFFGFNPIDNGPDPGIFDPNEEFEADLDVSWSGAIAPYAAIDLVLSASTNTSDGVDLSELYIVDNNVGDVMTESFGSCEGAATSTEAQGLSDLAEQAAAEGITYMVSSGDSGAEGCVDPNSASASGAQPSVNLLAATPFSVAVGGTMFNEGTNSSAYWYTTNNQSNLSSARSYIPENVWNESCSTCGMWAGGGGASTFFSKPNWQSGVAGIPNDGARDVPDVSLTAAGGHDPYLLCFEGSCSQGSLYGVGGTSASAPSFAGIMALIVQQYGRQGAANYTLYKLAAGETLSQCNGSSTTGLPNAACIFNDVTKGNNAVYGELNYGNSSALYQAGTGYDLATGLGSVNANNLVNEWGTVTFNATTTTLGPSTITGTHGSPVSLNISVAPSSGSGTPTGDISLQTGLNNPANPAFLTLSNGTANSSVSDLPGGSYTLTARYSGDATYAPSTSNGVQLNVTPENSTTTASMFTAAPNGAPIPFTSGPYGGFVYPRADVSGLSGYGVPTGYVWFYDNGNGMGALALNSQGNTAYPNGCWGCFGVGLHSLTAFFGGDSSFNSSTSAPVTFTVTQANSTTSVTANPTSAATGTPIGLTANIVSPAFAGAQNIGSYPSGTVTFWSGNSQIGSAPVFANGPISTGIAAIASFSTSSLPSGSNVITAQYSGDTNYLGSSSSTVTVNISADFSFASANNSIAVTQGGSVSNTLTITGQTGYSNTVNFTSASCSGLPSLTTCSFNPTSVVGSGATTITFRTTAPSYAAARGLELTGVGFVFAGVLLLGVPSRRLRAYAALSIVFCALAVGSIGCGGGSSQPPPSPGTPKGSYPITVTAETSDNVITHTASFTLVVQ
jgi:Pro-kumamolisin, activation domain/Bacterial Ig-like domain (group 3)